MRIDHSKAGVHAKKIRLTFFIAFWFAVCCLAACHLEPLSASRDKLPEPAGAELFNNACQSCHDLERALTIDGDEQTWHNTIQRMREDFGAQVSAAEIEKIVAYHVERQQRETRVFQEKCQLCHGRKEFGGNSFSSEQVRSQVREMQRRAGNRITDADVELIVNYHIREHRTALDRDIRRALGLEEKNLQPWQTIGRTLFLEKCSVCHDLGRAVGTLQDRNAWKMSLQKMREFSQGAISEADVEKLIDYHIQEQQRELAIFQETCTACHTEDRFTARSMTEEETLRLLLKMQGLAPDMISDDKVQVLFLFHQRQEKALADLFEGRCRECHQFGKLGEQVLPPSTQNLHTLVTRAGNTFGASLRQPDVLTLLSFHRKRESMEMAVFRKPCAICHDPTEKDPLLKERILQISILQGRELDQRVEETIKTQILFHRVEQTRR